MSNKKTFSKPTNLNPVFPSLVQSTKKQEDYIAKMIKKDKVLGY